MKFGLSEKEWLLLDQILIQPLKKYSVRVWIFGSRARGDHAKFSDVDILYSVPAEAALPPNFLYHLKDDLENSNLPYKVDLVDEKDLAESYSAHVLNERVPL